MWFSAVLCLVSVPFLIANENGCPYPAHQTDRLSTSTGHTCKLNQSGSPHYANCEPLFASMECESFTEISNSPFSVATHGSLTPAHLALFISHEGFQQPPKCNLQYLTFPRLAINLTVIEKLSEPLMFMYGDSLKVNESKCFSLRPQSDVRCSGKTENSSDDTQKYIVHCGIGASNSYTSFKFLINGKVKEFLFRNMFNEDFVDGVIFFYNHVDQTERNDLIITFQALSDIHDYAICVKEKNLNQGTTYNNRCISIVNVNLLDETTYLERFQDLITVRLRKEIFNGNGDYEIILTCHEAPNGANNKSSRCKPSKAYGITLKPHLTVLQVAIVTFVTLILLLLISSVGAVLYARWKVFKPISGTKKMLILYDARTIEHVEYVMATNELLGRLLKIEIKIDFKNIQETEHKNPSKWCYKTIVNVADHILIVVPPKRSGKHASQYHGLYEIGLKDIAKSLTTPNRCIKIILPDSDESESTIEELLDAPSFKIPHDYFSLRQHLQSTKFPLPEWLLFTHKTTNRIFKKILEDVRQNRTQKTREHSLLLLEYRLDPASDTYSTHLEEFDIEYPDIATFFDGVVSVDDLDL